jgi:hypothetical protein
MQMVCALLVFKTAQLPRSLGQLSPWLDWLVSPHDEVYAQLAAQQHRRFIKTHTPLDGLPIDPRVTYLVVGRHPLDMAVSLYHHSENIDRTRVRELSGPRSVDERAALPPLHDWLLEWIDWDGSPHVEMDSLPGVMWHLSDAWSRRREPNIRLVHYDELSNELEATMRDLASYLGIEVREDQWEHFVAAARFEHMKARAALLIDPSGVLKDRARFFRRGRSGDGRQLLTHDEQERYRRRAAQLAPPDLRAWLHQDGRSPVPSNSSQTRVRAPEGGHS